MRKMNNCNGSITLEAAMVVPFFIILMLLVNGFFVMFMGQQIMSHALVQSAKSLAFDPYTSQKVAADAEDELADMFVDIFSFTSGNRVSTDKWYDDSNLDDLDEVVKERYVAYLKDSETDAKELLNNIGVKDGLDGLDFTGCSVEDGILTVHMKYTQEFIYNAAGLASFDRELSVKVKLFEFSE